MKQTRKGKREEEEILAGVRGVASAASKYVPAKLGKGSFDKGKLSSVGKSASEMIAKAEAAAKAQSDAAFNAAQQQAQSDAQSLGDKAGGLNKNTKDDDDDSDGLLAILRMIFKIVPIGVNIVKNSKNLATGFKLSGMGLVDLIKNLAITSIIFGVDTIKFAFELGYYAFKMMICSVGGILNIHKCILFYLFDLFLLLMLLIITSILFMVDMFLGVKALIGMSCVEMLIWGLDLLEKFDQWVFQMFGAHVFHYPDFIINMCYRCSAMGDTSGFSNSSKKMFNDIFVMLPNKIGSPIGNIVRGIGTIFGFFSL